LNGRGGDACFAPRAEIGYKNAMPGPFQDQVAVVTGAASGLGRAIARRLHEGGARVALLDRHGPAADGAAAELGGRAGAFALDVTDEAAVARVFGRIEDELGRVDILVNSAGITGRTNLKSHEVDLADFRLVFEVNVAGCFLTSRAVLPGMLRRKYGRVLHIASVSGKEGNAGMLAYSASKAAVIGMTKVQGKEYAGTGVTVNALAPAVIHTPIIDALPPAQVKYMTDRIPMGRTGTLEEVAHMAAFIVSPGTSFTTGFTFDLTGGRATY
jgi:3-oxoacyl-[acyl-carrier protein] reductase